jgi:aminoglycoside phosphotransferase (APT) family kinase protein
MPCTVVHGDFVPKNVRVARRAGRLVVLPFDWETAGWGPPAADLASFQKGIRPDLTHYANAVAGAWPGLGIDDLMAMSDLGRLFRVLAAIDWASVGLTDRSAGYAAEELDYFVTELEDWQMPV